MQQLARRAGVSPATPYNLVGSKSELLKLVVSDEFEAFSRKQSGLICETPLAHLFSAFDLVAEHYASDRAFYASLYRAVLDTDGAEISYMMLVAGRSVWCDLVKSAVDAGELEGFLDIEPFTDVLLRLISITTAIWLGGKWSNARFRLELGLALKLVIASVASPEWRKLLLSEIQELQIEIANTRQSGRKTARKNSKIHSDA